MQDLGTLQGDFWSVGLAINDTGDVVGLSQDTGGKLSAAIWHNGQPTDLNGVVPAGTSLYMLIAFGINEGGQIVGFGVDMNTGEIHGYLAMPIAGSGGPTARGATQRPILSQDQRKALLRRVRF